MKRKYRAGAYIPRILEAMEGSPPMTRRQIADKLGAAPESIATAMLDLMREGKIEKLPHTPHVAAAYRLPIKAKPRPDVVKWVSRKVFAWSDQHEVSLPRAPWEAVQ